MLIKQLCRMRENENETTDLTQAVKVKTDYLSKEKGSNNIIDEFDKATDKSPDFRDLQIVFKVKENNASGAEARTLKNIAEITDDSNIYDWDAIHKVLRWVHRATC